MQHRYTSLPPKVFTHKDASPLPHSNTIITPLFLLVKIPHHYSNQEKDYCS